MTADFDDVSLDEVSEDVGRDAVADELADEIRKEKLRRLRQANSLRDSFFWVACVLAGGTTLTSIGLVVCVLAGAQIADTVAVAFISGLAIETVGILAIMAGYLFPRDRGAED